MAKPKETIKLKNQRGNVSVFSIEHATKLLNLQKEKAQQGWEIAEENWTHENNEISRRADTKGSKKPE